VSTTTPIPAEVAIVRNAENDIKMRGLEIYLDGEYVDDLSFNSQFTSQVTPGSHTVTVSNHLYKKTLTVDVAPGERVELQAGNKFTLLGGLMVAVLGIGPYRVFLTQSGIK
jgi:hypothetical protein